MRVIVFKVQLMIQTRYPMPKANLHLSLTLMEIQNKIELLSSFFAKKNQLPICLSKVAVIPISAVCLPISAVCLSFSAVCLQNVSYHCFFLQRSLLKKERHLLVKKTFAIEKKNNAIRLRLRAQV